MWNDVGLHLRCHRNQSTLVYDNRAGGNYIEDKQLLNTVVRCLNDRLRKDPGVKWPPTIAELENEEEPNHCLKMFLGWLKNPALKNSSKCSSPYIPVLASLIKSFIGGKHSIFRAKLSPQFMA